MFENQMSLAATQFCSLLRKTLSFAASSQSSLLSLTVHSACHRATDTVQVLTSHEAEAHECHLRPHSATPDPMQLMKLCQSMTFCQDMPCWALQGMQQVHKQDCAGLSSPILLDVLHYLTQPGQ